MYLYKNFIYFISVFVYLSTVCINSIYFGKRGNGVCLYIYFCLLNCLFNFGIYVFIYPGV